MSLKCWLTSSPYAGTACASRATSLQLEQPKRGHLIVSTWDGTSNAFRRTVRVAHLYHENRRYEVAGLLLPLFEPQRVKVTDRGFLLAGLEIASERNGGVVMQGWWARMASR